MSDLLKAMADLEGLVPSAEPPVGSVRSALAELESATWGLQKSMTPRVASTLASPARPTVDASTSMAKSSAAEASAHVAKAWQSYRENH